MADPKNNLQPELYPAIRDALVKALDAAAPSPCEICGKAPAQPYAFAYAHQLESFTAGNITRTTYGPVAARAANLRNNCMLAHKRRALSTERRKMFSLIFAAAVVIVGVLVAIGIVPLDWRWILLALAGFLGFLALVASSQRSDLTKNPRLAGSQLALSLYEDELKREGFSIWQDEDLYRLVP